MRRPGERPHWRRRRRAGGMPDLPLADPGRVLRRRWTGAESWRDTKLGMWAWLLQRLAALLLIVDIALHLRNPFARAVQAALLGLVLFHGLLGVRAILLFWFCDEEIWVVFVRRLANF